MDRPGDSQNPTTMDARRDVSKAAPSLSAKSCYLILYNSVSAALWLVVLGRLISSAASKGTTNVFYDIGLLTKWTQTLAVLEIVHSLTGLCMVSEKLTRTLTICLRHRTCTSLDDVNASSISLSPRLDCRRTLPINCHPQSGLHDNATRVERYRSHTLLVFRHQFSLRQRTWMDAVAKI